MMRIVSLFVILLLSHGLQAATFTVLNNANSGAGSLHQAILDANADASLTNTIVFDSAVNGQTINLSSVLPLLNDVLATTPGSRTLNIVGNGSASTIISGNNTHRIFFAHEGVVNLSGMTLKDGVAQGGSGAAGSSSGSGGGGGLGGNAGLASSSSGGGSGGGGLYGNGGSTSGDLAGSGGGGYDSDATSPASLVAAGSAGGGINGGAGGAAGAGGGPSDAGSGLSGGPGGGGGGGGAADISINVATRGGAGGIGGWGGGGGGAGITQNLAMPNAPGGAGGDFGGGGAGSRDDINANAGAAGGDGGFGGGGGGGGGKGAGVHGNGGAGGFGAGGGGGESGGFSAFGGGVGGIAAGTSSNGGGGGLGAGGALFVDQAAVSLDDVVFDNNQAIGGSGGSGANGGGGGGAGFGGSIFVRDGGSLSYSGGALGNGGVTAGAGGSGGGGSGAAKGAGLYLMDTTLNINPGAGKTVTLMSDIDSSAGYLTQVSYLAKNGAGTLLISPATDVNLTSQTLINAGTLENRGNLAGGALVMPGSTLINSGSIAGSVAVDGLYSGIGSSGNLTIDTGVHDPGSRAGVDSTVSFGTHTVNGNYNFNSAGAQLRINASTSQSDQVIVNGAVNVPNGTLAVYETDGPYVFPVVYTLIDNDGIDPVIGTFATASNLLSHLTLSLAYNGGTGNDVVLSLQRNSTSFATQTGLDASASAVALTLDAAYTMSLGTDARDLYTGVLTAQGDARSDALLSLAGEVYPAMVDRALDFGANGIDYLMARQMRSGLVTAGRERELAGFSKRMFVHISDPRFMLAEAIFEPPVDTSEQALEEAGGLEEESTVLAPVATINPTFNVWADAFMGDGVNLLGLGVDWTLGGINRLGLAMFRTNDSDGKIEGIENATAKGSDTMFVLTGTRKTGPLLMSLGAGWMISGRQVSRELSFGGFSKTATGDTTGNGFVAGLEAGLPLKYKWFDLTPSLGWRMSSVTLSQGTEKGAAAANLEVADLKASAQEYRAGLLLDTRFEKLRPRAHLGFRGNISRDASVGNHNFSFTSTSFAVFNPVKAPENHFDLGVGLDWSITRVFTLGADTQFDVTGEDGLYVGLGLSAAY